MEFLFVIVLIIGGLYWTVAPIVAGYLATPGYWMFLGTIHHANDYFYYLSQIAQGRDSWFLGRDLFTSEFPAATLVGWVNVVIGKIGALAGVSPIAIYHGAVGLFTVCVFLSGYFLTRLLFFGEKNKRLMAILSLFFTISSTVFSLPTWEKGKLAFKQFDYWFNFGNPRERFSSVPHQLVMHSTILLIWCLFTLGSRWEKQPKKYAGILVLLVVSGFILGSLQPIQWATIVGILGLWAIVRFFRIHPHITFFLPSFALGLGGIAPVLALKALFDYPPYVQLAAWEAANSVLMSWSWFLGGLGPIVILGVVGILVAAWKKKIIVVPLILYLFITIVSFFSPLPSLVHIQNVRFLSPAMVAIFSLFASYGIVTLCFRLQKPFRFVVLFLIIGLYVLSVAPALSIQIPGRLETNPGNAYFYIPAHIYKDMIKARDISTIDDQFIVMWPYHLSFPGVTGRRGFWGHPLLTIDSTKKDELVYHFFSNIMTPKEQEQFLVDYHITYIVAEPWEYETLHVRNIEPVYKGDGLWIYRVINK